MYHINMERHYESINRNRVDYNHIRNNNSRNGHVTPEIHANQMWLREEDTSGVKIIELNSSTDSAEEPFVRHFSHAWSYVNNGTSQKLEEDDYRVNQEARRRRRLNMDLNGNDFASIYANQHNYKPDNLSNNDAFYNTYGSEIGSAPINHQMNCFTIINHHKINSDSSDSENYEEIEIIELDKSRKNKYWDHVYNEKVVTHDKDTPSENRTIWIYSYKNKRLLADNDFEVVNIPSKDISSTSTSYSISDEEQHVDKPTSSFRAASPIPVTYIPRLDLTLVQTLSTVTEVSERNKSHSKDSSHEKINLKQRNNWLWDRNDKYKLIENSNVVNWMALSPRERRRRSINTSSIDSSDNILETEVTHVEGIKQNYRNSIESNKINSSTMHVKADVHVDEQDTRRELHKDTSNNGEEIEEVKKVTNILPMNIIFADVGSDVDNNIEIDYSMKPSIQINSKVKKGEITDPIEKLDSHNWIAEEKVEKETVYNYDINNGAEIVADVSNSENADCDSVSRRLWTKNLQLMKPPQWTEYLPIAESLPSLHLTISLSSINGKKSWLKRLAKCMKCCK